MQMKLFRIYAFLLFAMALYLPYCLAQSPDRADAVNKRAHAQKHLTQAEAEVKDIVKDKDDPDIDYTTSWIGNSFGGDDPKPPTQTLYHVPINMNAIFVSPDGRVFTNTGWDEGGRSVSQF